jgi:hypothetical protein
VCVCAFVGGVGSVRGATHGQRDGGALGCAQDLGAAPLRPSDRLPESRARRGRFRLHLGHAACVWVPKMPPYDMLTGDKDVGAERRRGPVHRPNLTNRTELSSTRHCQRRPIHDRSPGRTKMDDLSSKQEEMTEMPSDFLLDCGIRREVNTPSDASPPPHTPLDTSSRHLRPALLLYPPSPKMICEEETRPWFPSNSSSQ